MKAPRATVLDPQPLLTITVEAAATGGDEIHVHAGGQGLWIARMLGVLGVEVTLCGCFGGETGRVARLVAEEEGLNVRCVDAGGANGAYLHDRRGGTRVPVARMDPAPLGRHEVDALYGAVLVLALEADVCVLGGPTPGAALHGDIYRRLANDLRAHGRRVIADLSGEPLVAALAGGLDVVKLSHEEVLDDDWAPDDSTESLIRAMTRIRSAGADNVVVSRADAPALALVDDDVLEVAAPRLASADVRGAGDSMTAGLAAGLAWGRGMEAALCIGAAAGALNVTRRGLATGNREDIDRMTERVEVRWIADAGAHPARLA